MLSWPQVGPNATVSASSPAAVSEQPSTRDQTQGVGIADDGPQEGPTDGPQEGSPAVMVLGHEALHSTTNETIAFTTKLELPFAQWGAMEATHERAEKQYNVTWRELEQGLPHGLNLGRVAEVGCGPHMQLFGLLWFRPDLQVEQISAIDPGMPGCALS